MTDMYSTYEQFFLNNAQKIGGSYLPTGLPSSGYMASGWGSDKRIAKANNIFGITATDGIDAKYSAMMPEWIKRKANAYSLLRKTDFDIMGDAFKVWFDDPTTITDVVKGVTEVEDIFDTNDRIQIQRVNGTAGYGILPKIIQCHWVEGLLHQRKQAGFQNEPRITPEKLRGAYTRLWMKQLNKMVLRDVGTLAGNDLLSLDSLISGYDESVARSLSGGEVNFWNLDRESAETNADSFLNVSATVRGFDLENFDDMLAELSDFDPSDPMCITSPLLVNRMERSIQAKQNFIGKSQFVIERNGVQTRAGEKTGFQITTYSGGGVKEFPIFGDSDVTKDAATNSLGNIYVIDNDDAELRRAMPQAYWNTGNDFALVNQYGNFTTRNLLAVVEETVISNPRKHAKMTALN